MVKCVKMNPVKRDDFTPNTTKYRVVNVKNAETKNVPKIEVDKIFGLFVEENNTSMDV